MDKSQTNKMQNAKMQNAIAIMSIEGRKVFLITGHYNSSTGSVKLTIFQSLM
jgi:hypothetical protein